MAHGLFGELENYANVAMVEFQSYNDTSDERCLLTGSYAVFGLGLKSEKYFPLVKRYFSLVDDEHQNEQVKFIEAFIDRWGVSEQSLDVIMKGILSYQNEKIYKNLGALMKKSENKILLSNALKKLDGYEKGYVAYAVWGKGWQDR